MQLSGLLAGDQLEQPAKTSLARLEDQLDQPKAERPAKTSYSILNQLRPANQLSLAFFLFFQQNFLEWMP